MTSVPKNITIPTLKMLALYRGIQGRVAARLGVDASFVSKVVHGKKRSARVESELRKELGRAMRRAA